MNDQTIEQEIQAKGLTAPRITPADIETNIAAEHYFTAADGDRGAAFSTARDFCDPSSPLSLLTFCVLTLRNGFTVTGESACASPENFDAEVGRRIARQNAVGKVWALMGYELRSQLHDQEQQAAAMAGVQRVSGPGILHRGTKDLRAWPMTRGAYNTYRGWPLPSGENADDSGYLVEYLDGGTSNHLHHAGYISWSPADVFTRAYKPVPASD